MSENHEQPTGCTCARLRKLARATTRHYDQCMAPTGLKVNQYSLMNHVLRGGEVTVSELAEMTSTDRTTLTRNLKPLIEAGWLSLRPGSDGRQRIVSLTAAGHAKIEEARPFWRSAQDDIERILGNAEVLALHGRLDAALATITTHLKEE